MFYTLRTALYFAGTYFRSKRMMRKNKNKSIEEQRKAGLKFMRYESGMVMKKTGSRVIYHGLENIPEKPGVLFVGNHTSILDVLVIYSVMDAPTAFVSKKELNKTPMIGALLRFLGCVPLDRENVRQALKAVETASNQLEEGVNMVIFPEGTRSKTGEIAEFKKGSIRIATQVGAPIVPFRIENLRNVLENNKGIKVVPQEVHVHFGEAIEIKDMNRKEQKELAEKMRDIVIAIP